MAPGVSEAQILRETEVAHNSTAHQAQKARDASRAEQIRGVGSGTEILVGAVRASLIANN